MSLFGVNVKTSKFPRIRTYQINMAPRAGFSFLPGAFLIALGVLVLFFPRFFIAAIAALMLFLGCLFCFVAWKVIQLKSRFDTMAKNFESKVSLQAFQVNQNDVTEIEVEEKKIVFH